MRRTQGEPGRAARQAADDDGRKVWNRAIRLLGPDRRVPPRTIALRAHDRPERSAEKREAKQKEGTGDDNCQSGWTSSEHIPRRRTAGEVDMDGWTNGMDREGPGRTLS